MDDALATYGECDRRGLRRGSLAGCGGDDEAPIEPIGQTTDVRADHDRRGRSTRRTSSARPTTSAPRPTWRSPRPRRRRGERVARGHAKCARSPRTHSPASRTSARPTIRPASSTPTWLAREPGLDPRGPGGCDRERRHDERFDARYGPERRPAPRAPPRPAEYGFEDCGSEGTRHRSDHNEHDFRGRRPARDTGTSAPAPAPTTPAPAPVTPAPAPTPTPTPTPTPDPAPAPPDSGGISPG